MSTHLRIRISITFLLILVTMSNSVSEQGRYYAPWLIFPPTAPTRHQLISGIGIPLGTPESIVSGWVLKAQYFLPTSVNDLRPVYLEGWNDSRKSIAKRDTLAVVTPLQGYRASQNAEVSKEDDDLFDDSDDEYWSTLDEEQHARETTRQSSTADEDLSTIPAGYDTNLSRWSTYKALEQIGAIYGAGGRECVLRSICEAASAEFTHTGGIFAELLHIVFTKGFNGRSCLLRTICEAAEAKFSHSSGIIGELLHILLTPSTTPEEPAPEGKEDIHVPHEEYKRAELVASRSSPRTRFAGSSVCSDMYAECPFSLLDLFSGIL